MGVSKKMKNGKKMWPNIIICSLVIGVLAGLGYLLRIPLVTGFDHVVMPIVSYAVYLFCCSQIIWSIYGKDSTAPEQIILNLIVCGVAACLFYGFYRLCCKNLSWIFLMPLPEIAVFVLLSLCYTDKTESQRRKILWIDGSYIVLSIALVLLFTRDAILISPFYLNDTRQRAVWVHNALKTVNELITLLSVIHSFSLLLAMNVGEEKKDTHAVAAKKALAVVCLFLVFFIFRVIVSPQGALSMYYNREREGVVEEDNLYGIYSKVSRPICIMSGVGRNDTELTNVAPDSVELYDEYKGRLLAVFTTVEGNRKISGVEQKDFVSDYANEVILLREDGGWKAYYTKELKNEPANELLTEAIWDGVDKGYLLLAVYASDYLEKNDTEEFRNRVHRWSQDHFTAGESTHFAHYDKQALINWAIRER